MLTTIIAETCPAPQCNLSEREIEGLVDELKTYHTLFQPAFRRSEQFQWSGVYLNGRKGDEPRKTIEPIALSQGENVRDLQHLVQGQSPWLTTPIVQIHQRLVGETLGEADAVIVVDESGIPKQGDDSVGVARQYCGAVGKVANCQVGVYVGYASRKGYTLVDGRLYMPQEWFDAAHAPKRLCGGVPQELMFKTKPTLALEMVLNEDIH